MKKRTNILLLTALGTLLLTACNEDELIQNNTPATGTRGSLHVTEITLPEGGMQTRVALENGNTGVDRNYMPFNVAATGFDRDGDLIEVNYSFGGEADYSGTLYYNGSEWSFNPYSATDNQLHTRPNQYAANGESWANFSMQAYTQFYAKFNENESYTQGWDYTTYFSTNEGALLTYFTAPAEWTYIAENGRYTANGTILDARMYLDKLVASTEEGGGITADTEVTSPTLGSFRVALKHAHAMLRLPKSAITMEKLIVEGQEITPTFKTLWAELSYTSSEEEKKMYIPLTEVTLSGNTEVYQAIVPVEENGAAITLTGFQMVYTDGEERSYTHVFDLGDGAVALAANTRYPLILAFGPRKAEVTLTAPGKPGWGDDEVIYNIDMNEALSEVAYTAGTGAAGTFTVSGSKGLQLLNQWMVGSMLDGVYTALTGAPYNWPDGAEENRMMQNITLAEDIILPNKDLSTTNEITLDEETGQPSGSNWIPLGSGTHVYSGTFDGNGKKITGLRIVSDANNVGLVNVLGNDGTVMSLTLTNAVVHSTSTYTDQGQNSVGLIAGQNNGYVNSCNVSGSSVKGMYYVGGIVGTNYHSVTNCIVENGSSATGMNYVGGIVGMNNETVSSCINRGSATATGYSGDVKYCYAGGIVGTNNGGTVSGCKNQTSDASSTATVTSDNYAGGIAGENSAGGTVSTSTNNGTVEITSNFNNTFAGGIVGANYGTSNIIVCGDWGTVRGAIYAGGIVGNHSNGTATACWTTQNKAIGYNGGTPTACYYQGNQDGDKKWYGTGVESVNTAEVVNAMNIAIAIWNAANTSNTVAMGWQVSTSNSYPDMATISNITGFPTATKVDDFYQIGENYYNADGTIAYQVTKDGETITGYTVYTASGLQAWNTAVLNNLSLNLTLEADITLPATDLTTGEAITVTDGIPSGSNWTPLGNSSNKYTGTIDGGGHTITGLRISSTSQNTGLVGALEGSVKDLMLNDAVVHSTAYSTGGIVGNNIESTVSGCTVSGTVTGTGYVGGIAGYNSGSVTACSNTATVTGTQNVGGIAGRNEGGTITACGNTATVTGESYVGGIAGMNDGGTITACGNTATVTGTKYRYVGGIAGYNLDSATACWTKDTNETDGSEVTTDKDGIGGMVSIATATACYSGDAATINGKVTDMNSAIGTTITWNWQAGTGTNDWPTLVSTATE